MRCCSNSPEPKGVDPCAPPTVGCCAHAAPCAPPMCAGVAEGPCAHFERMIGNCLAYAEGEHAAGRPIVGILCEYTPRELIMAAGAVPVCLCGGSAETIADAEAQLPSNLCPLIKSTYGYHVQKSNPFLEMASLIVGETTCDGKKKMYELLGESRPMYVLELPQKQEDPEAFEHWVAELRRLKKKLESCFSVQITDEALRRAIRVMNRERALRRELAAQMKGDPPPFSGRQLLDYKSSISGVEIDFAQYERVLEICKAKGPDPALAGRVRVLLTGVPTVHGAERVVELIEAHGGVVVCMESCTGVKPVLEDVDEQAQDPIRAVAERYFRLPCSVMTPNERRMELLRALAGEYRAECVIELIWQACLTYDVEAQRVKRLAEEALHLPYLRIETDYSPSDSARIAVRVEALFETVQHGAPARGGCGWQ